MCDREKHTVKNWNREPHSAIFFVSSRESKTQKRESFSWEVQSKKIERNTQLRAETESHIRPFFCEFQREKNTEKRELQLRGAVQKDREKHNKSVREWKKKETSFFVKLHTRKINWWSFHGVFKCYNDGVLEYSEKDFATGFVVRLYLLLEIYLLYIQFIVDSSLE